MAERILMNEFKKLSQPGEIPWLNVQLGKSDDLFLWDVAIIVLNPTSLYYGGYFKASKHTNAQTPNGTNRSNRFLSFLFVLLQAELKFPKNYPYSPPEFRFLRPLWHPNIYPDGKLCISILHPPGEDEMSGELASERWSPVQNVESVLISILSLLDDAEVSSAANVDAGVMLRKDPEGYKKIVRENVETSKKDIPDDFVMPESAEIKPPPKDDTSDDFWYDSGAESFDGSDGGSFGGSDAEMTYDEDDDGQEDDTEDDDVEEDSAEEDARRIAATPNKKVLGLNVEDSSRTATPRPT
ncbi:hypothetical protein H072_8667 [Dactylellina haptotyla CBS 200.50]|uniref:Ubiquitin-conjugating enzyme E2 2 n=1 Tax=Dactylellina haptotyla (strain CBS 200.50) TaxID=1284197 RepID=S8A3N9_DACHA|nr:hypothetical protein H072_8667 [Dactylellina haptotyla CBS 200.50]